jgi:tRNA dimethylallyltransferase
LKADKKNSIQPHLIVICGPTGIGKTQVAIEIASYFKTIIISADSRQIFREMSIGTAAPNEQELKRVPHFFAKSRSIHEPFNASIYENEVIRLLEERFKENPLIVMAGGSGLYIDAVCNGIDDLPTIDKKIRERWHLVLNEQGIVVLQEKVKEVDPEYYNQVDINNPKRLQKAIEVFEMTGKPYSSFLTKSKKERPFKIIKLAINTEREELYRLINRRVDKMLENGLMDEVRNLYQYRNLLPLKTVGYSELFDYFDGKLSLDEAVTKIKDHTRAYARRQITWFRRDKSVKWFEPSETEAMILYIEKQIKE